MKISPIFPKKWLPTCEVPFIHRHHELDFCIFEPNPPLSSDSKSTCTKDVSLFPVKNQHSWIMLVSLAGEEEYVLAALKNTGQF